MLCHARSAPDDQESTLFLSLEQALPVRPSWLSLSRLKFRVERPLPLPLPGFGGAEEGPPTLHLRARGGVVRGPLPPYEAFAIGGTNSVRGFSGGRAALRCGWGGVLCCGQSACWGEGGGALRACRGPLASPYCAMPLDVPVRCGAILPCCGPTLI